MVAPHTDTRRSSGIGHATATHRAEVESRMVSVGGNMVSRMRILHTSDWHIGFRMRGVPLPAAQEQVLVEEIPALVAECEVDVVVVAGDVYDSQDPSEAEIEVCQAAFTEIRAAGAELVVIAGNHDSPIWLGAGAWFTASGGLHLRTTVAGIGTPVLFEDEHGLVAVYGIPCLHFAGAQLGLSAGCSYADSWRAAMAQVRADMARRPGVRSVVVAHAAVADPSTGGVDRLHVGGRSTVPVDVFAGVDYVALGDLHWPHAVTPTVRYSGSPLPYVYDIGPQAIDFDPPKSLCLVDLGPDGALSMTPCPPLVPSAMVRIEGSTAELAASEGSLDYVCASLTDAVRPVDVWRRLRARFPHLVRVEWADPHTAAVTPLHLDEPEPQPPAVDVSSAAGEVWRGFYGEMDEPCLRCGAQPGRPCFQVRCAIGAATIDTFHRERGLTATELAELGYAAYDVDDHGARRQLRYDPRRPQRQVRREGCYPVADDPPAERIAKEAGEATALRTCTGPHCGETIASRRAGRPAQYCSSNCRVRAHRARQTRT